jgi:hypothetical protein
MDITLIFEGVNLERLGRGGDFFDPVLFIHTPFPPLSFQLFYLPLSNSGAKGKLFLGRKYLGVGGGISSPCPPVTPMTPEIIHIRCKTARYMKNGPRKATKFYVNK